MHKGTRRLCGSRSGCCVSALGGGFGQESAGGGDLLELRGSATFPQAAGGREPPPALGRRPTSVGALEYREGGTVPAELEHPTPGLPGELGGEIDELLHHCFDTPALGRMPDRSIRANEGLLAHQAQDVVGECSERQDQGVGGELARGQTLQIEVATRCGAHRAGAVRSPVGRRSE